MYSMSRSVALAGVGTTVTACPVLRDHASAPARHSGSSCPTAPHDSLIVTAFAVPAAIRHASTIQQTLGFISHSIRCHRTRRRRGTLRSQAACSVSPVAKRTQQNEWAVSNVAGGAETDETRRRSARHRSIKSHRSADISSTCCSHPSTKARTCSSWLPHAGSRLNESTEAG